MATPAPPMFGMDMVDIAQEASERAGIEFRAGYSLRSARISLELLTIEWGNRGLNLWTIDHLVIPLNRDDREIALPDDTIDVIEHYVRSSDGAGGYTDLPLDRMAQSQYAAIPNK